MVFCLLLIIIIFCLLLLVVVFCLLLELVLFWLKLLIVVFFLYLLLVVFYLLFRIVIFLLLIANNSFWSTTFNNGFLFFIISVCVCTLIDNSSSLFFVFIDNLFLTNFSLLLFWPVIFSYPSNYFLVSLSTFATYFTSLYNKKKHLIKYF